MSGNVIPRHGAKAPPRDEAARRDLAQVKVVPLEWVPLEYLLFRMSDADKRELLCQCPTDNVLEIAWTIMNARRGQAWQVLNHGRPIGGFGTFEVHHGVWSLWAIGADNPAVAFTMLGELFDRVLPHVREHGGWRIEVKTRADARNNHDRLRLLGFKAEGRLRHYGTDRSHYLQCSYILPPEEKAASAAAPVADPEVLEPAPAA